jgi:hypothetical protein
MKTLLTLLLATLCVVSASGQTVRTLGFNTTNGNVIYGGTNTLTFTNKVSFAGGAIVNAEGIFYVTPTNGGLNLEEGLITDVSNNAVLNWSDSTILSVGRPLSFSTNSAAITRTNLGLPLPALTNTSNVTTMRALGGSTNTNEPFSGSFEVSVPGGNILMIFSNGIFLRQEQGS